MYTFIDIFSGIGGFRVALEKKGMKCVFSSEIDQHASDVYERNFGDRPYGDITEISESKIPEHDILCAGFPCQSFSISGKQGGLKDNRGRLFYEIVRIANYHQPYVLLLENVKNILTVDNGRVIKTIQKKLDEIGYRIHYSTLNASHYGVPQSRERVYFACVRKDLKTPESLDYKEPKPTYKNIYLESILEDIVDERLYIERDDIVIEKESDDYDLKPIRLGYVNKGGQGERIYSPKGHAITLSANGGGVGARTGLYLVKNRIRRLSKVECKRLMSFPDDHIISSGIQGYKQLGNAVIPSMIEKIYDSIMKIYKMSDVLNACGSSVDFTARGNVKIGKFVQFQRKGGNGNVKHIPKTDIKHPSNHIQIKLDIKSFLKSNVPLLSDYSI